MTSSPKRIFKTTLITKALLLSVFILIGGVTYTYADHGSCSGANYTSCVSGGTWQKTAAGNYINDPTPGGVCSCSGCTCVGSLDIEKKNGQGNFTNSGGSISTILEVLKTGYNPYIVSGYSGSSLTTGGLTSAPKTTTGTIKTSTKTSSVSPVVIPVKTIAVHANTVYTTPPGDSISYNDPNAFYTGVWEHVNSGSLTAGGTANNTSLGGSGSTGLTGSGTAKPSYPAGYEKTYGDNYYNSFYKAVLAPYQPVSALPSTPSTGYYSNPNDVIKSVKYDPAKQGGIYDSPFTDHSKPQY